MNGFKAIITYQIKIITWIDQDGGSNDQINTSLDFQDEKLDEAIEIGKRYGSISSSFLQRQLKIGYNRAARIVDYLEGQGLVEKSDGVKPRKWIG